MSNYEWNQDQGYGEKALDNLRSEERELRELLGVFIDATTLKGHTITEEQWERACLLCGRWKEPYIKRRNE